MPFAPAAIDSYTYTTKLEYTGNDLTYVGSALTGSNAAEPVWRIKKLFYDMGKLVNVYYADGNDHFDNVWNDRATYSYS